MMTARHDKGNPPMTSPTQIHNLEELFLHTLEDIYFAENAIVKALPTMAQKATNGELKHGFETHLKETKDHVSRLDGIFKSLGKPAKGTTCPAIEGIIEEADELAEIRDGQVKDAALASIAQAVEHYEISRYGTLIAFARRLGHDDLVQPLQETLSEEKATDAKLTKLSESSILKKSA
jgi:ferritin-like metal-binding protein YciE